MIILGCFGGTPIFGNTHIDTYLYLYDMVDRSLPEVEPGCLAEGLPKIDDHHDALSFGHSARIVLATLLQPRSLQESAWVL